MSIPDTELARAVAGILPRMKLSEWLRGAEARLATAGISAARLEAQLLAGHLLLQDRSWVLSHPEADINDLAAETLLQRREAQEPLAYIVGYREFYGRRFATRPGVLIPRQETETLVELALTLLPLEHTAKVLDLGTGSGCIGISLKLERPALDVTLSDLSEGALGIAAANAGALGANVRFVRSDFFESLPGETFDAILSNPPYVARQDPLPAEVQDHEPHLALYAGESGLDAYRRIANEAGSHLRPGGFLALEVGAGQAPTVQVLFPSPEWRSLGTYNDLSGIERVVAFSKVQPGHNNP